MSQKIDLNRMGFPGGIQHLVSVNQFRDSSDPRNLSGPEGSQGRYAVTFSMSRPGWAIHPTGSYAYEADLRGDSHLAICPPAYTPPQAPNATSIVIRGLTDDGSFTYTGEPNDKGFLAKLRTDPFDAASFDDAEIRAYRALTPVLSHWSAELDIPLHVYQLDTMEVETGNTRMNLVNPYPVVPFAGAPQLTAPDDLRMYCMLYREALCTSSPVYQFLCFYKMIEGLVARRNRLNAEACKRDEEPSRVVHRIPNDEQELADWLNTVYPFSRAWDAISLAELLLPEARGQKLTLVFQSKLRPIRDRIAHTLLDTGEVTISADDIVERRVVQKWLALMRCVVRKLLKAEFPNQFLAHVS